MSTLTTAGGPAIPSMNGTRRHRVIESPLGELTVVAEADTLASRSRSAYGLARVTR
jgi:hypothetical protein